MLNLQNRARRNAVKRERSSDSQLQSRWTSRNTASNSTGVFSGVVPSLQLHDSSNKLSELESPSACGSDCWARQADLQKPDGVLTIPSRLHDPAQDAVVALNVEVYESLRPSQTRLMVLQQGELGSEICCRLVTAEVIGGNGLGILETSDIVAYEALSYSWGPPALLYSITCNGKQFGVTEALAYALQYIRLRDAERYLWCDAICINQQDLLEKARQVKNMLRIFEKADRVIAWLGRPIPTSTKFFKMIEMVHPPSGEEHLESVWFRRTWIRQEVYAARKLVIQQGHLQSDFRAFVSSVEHMQMALASLDVPKDHIRVPPTLETYRNEYQHFGSDGYSFSPKETRPTYVQYWLDTINTGLLFDVTNESDRIYRALGLLTSSIVKFFAEVPEDFGKLAEAFPIDYGKTLTQVHEDVTKFLINTTKTLEILDVFQDKWSSGSGGPSWNIDFGRKQPKFPLPRPRFEAEKGILKALKQDHLEVGRLRLAGVQVIRSILRLDGEKEIGHPQDRFILKYKRSITLRHLMQGPLRRSSGTLSSGIDNSPFAFVFSHVQESERRHALSISHHLVKFEDMDAPFAEFLSSKKFVFAYIDDYVGTKSLGLGPLHFLVPRTASLDDTIVSLYGSKCLHLVRPLNADPTEWKYIGPIAAVAIDQESITKYQLAGLPGSNSKVRPKDVDVEDTQQAEIFVLH